MNVPRLLARVLPERAIRTLILRTNLRRRAMTLGVRIVAVDAEGRVLLVRHTYVSGWHLPGGGVDPGESAQAAAVRELWEETGFTATERPALVSLHRNRSGPGRDHVALFILRAFAAAPTHAPDGEIAEMGFFAREDLPEGTTASTRARLAELFDRVPASETW